MNTFVPSASREPSLPIAEQVYRMLREDIVALRMLPNERIGENMLVQQFGVSRTPIREALQRLEREGLVVIQPQRGSFVSPLDMQAIRSAYVARRALECAVCEEAARRHTPQDIEQLERSIADQRRIVAAGDRDSYFEWNWRFHSNLMVVADLVGLSYVIDNAKVHLDRVRSAHLTYAGPYPLEPLVEEHSIIVRAVASGNPATAEQAMRAHIEPLLPRLSILMKERPDFFEQPHRPGWARRT